MEVGELVSENTVLVELAERFLDRLGGARQDGGSVGDRSELANRLSLGDLVGDGQGEIVIEQPDGMLVLELDEAAVVTGQGIAGAHLTSSGEEVGGLGYVSFKSGLTVYYPAGLEVSLTPAAVG